MYMHINSYHIPLPPNEYLFTLSLTRSLTLNSHFNKGPRHNRTKEYNYYCNGSTTLMSSYQQIKMHAKKSGNGSFAQQTASLLKEYLTLGDEIVIDGKSLTIPKLHATSTRRSLRFKIADSSLEEMKKNSAFLEERLKRGAVIYGINTGFGGSADVRTEDFRQLQLGLLKHLNAGFGSTFQPEMIRAVMLIRANSLACAYSGVRKEVAELLLNMLEHDIIPVVPKRGSVSASGDLMPLSYIASCMHGREDCQVIMNGSARGVLDAFRECNLQPVTFEAKEALGVINASSCAAGLATSVIFDSCVCAVLTQIATGLAVEALRGHIESFHQTLHECMPYDGQLEVAATMQRFLGDSIFCIHQLDMNAEDVDGTLKQDRYSLRTSPQWLAPVVETLQESVRRITVEINSVSDNPIIDHRKNETIHGGNFQGISCTIAMDQTRQALQLCGKLLFAQMQEVVNVKLNNGLPPNLSGCDSTVDFGLKGMDTAMASYTSELDLLANPVTNHVLSAELHNQSVNSMALLSARKTEEALEVLQMMLCNILYTLAQAVDLRWLQRKVEPELASLYHCHAIEKRYVATGDWPWYDFAFAPKRNFAKLWDFFGLMPNGLTKEGFVQNASNSMETIVSEVKDAKYIKEVSSQLGKGTRMMYEFIRSTLDIKFYCGERAPDVDLRKLFSAVRGESIYPLVLEILEE